MLRGLEGRRIALFASGEDSTAGSNSAAVIQALEQAGARLNVLRAGQGADEDWHGARYAALVLIGQDGESFDGDARLVQLTREFFVADKPVAALGGATSVLLEAGGAAGRTIAARGPLKAAVESAGGKTVDEPICVDEALITAKGDVDIAAFATRVVAELSSRLEEHELDEMSESSFPASDPPATTPTSAGPAPDAESRP